MSRQSLSSLRGAVRALLVSVALLALLAPAGASAKGKSKAKAKATLEGVVNINTASAKELTLLPGVGPMLAQRIVDYRGKYKFKKILELARVRGIGLKTVRKLKPWLTVDGRTTLQRLGKKAKKADGQREASQRTEGIERRV